MTVRAVPKPTPKVKEPKRLQSKPHVIPDWIKNMVKARDRMRCRWCNRPGGALDAHHIRRRSQGGKDEAANLVSVHRICHEYIHAHPAEAKARGFLDDPADRYDYDAARRLLADDLERVEGPAT